MVGIDPRGLVKIHGNWCGPDHTGGFDKPWGELDDVEKRVALQPVDTLDACCNVHDICFDDCRKEFLCDSDKRAQCMSDCNTTLRQCSIQSGNKTMAPFIGKGMEFAPDPGENQCECEADMK